MHRQDKKPPPVAESVEPGTQVRRVSEVPLPGRQRGEHELLQLGIALVNASRPRAVGHLQLGLDVRVVRLGQPPPAYT